MKLKKTNIKKNERLGTVYENPKQDPKWAERWQPDNIREYKNDVYNKISELLLLQFSKLEPYIKNGSIESLQKTYKDGKLVTGKKHNDMMVVYESDIDANADDEKIEGA